MIIKTLVGTLYSIAGCLGLAFAHESTDRITAAMFAVGGTIIVWMPNERKP